MLPPTRLVSLAARCCEVLHVGTSSSAAAAAAAAAASTPKYNILFLPGNPGLPGFYRKFFECLNRKLPHADAQFRISAVGLKGHASLDVGCSPFAHYGIEEQCAHIAEYVAEDVSRDPNERTILVGHSIGAYFGVEALRRMAAAGKASSSKPSPSPVVSFVGLMPFFESNDRSPHYRRLGFLLRFFWPVLYVLGAIAQLLGTFAPPSLKALALSSQTDSMDPDMIDFTARSMLSFPVVCNFLWLGKTEFDNHNIRPFDFGRWLPALPTRLLYTDNDFWAPRECHDRAVAAGVDSTFMPGQKHAFGVSTRTAEPIAEWFAEHVRQVVAKG
jgi:pimeloyl-ACP methyl ester carboxylesterase